jgi:hypothetical protein
MFGPHYIPRIPDSLSRCISKIFLQANFARYLAYLVAPTSHYERMRMGMPKKGQKVQTIIDRVTRSPPLLLRLYHNVALRTNSCGAGEGAQPPPVFPTLPANPSGVTSEASCERALQMFYLLCVRSVTRMQKVSQTAAAA